ncbi:hypothetical protein [Hymenobacter metallilatus]|uniref:Uncharacterized protein n=1 Tax=Hymenobacter metallilatus TaxID=2493666 RepID=A0A3R9NZ16_9BACT|nr:hypothetical protein [Hymenobacter metallilatus]RSK24209.1 hypothetical protein EI290_20735 [Hymenobacter metallilatus]
MSTPSEQLAHLGTPQFYRRYAGFRGAFYKIWPCGAYELITFGDTVSWLYLFATFTDNGESLQQVAKLAKPITRAEYETAVTRCLDNPNGSVLARPAAVDWKVKEWNDAHRSR